MTEKEVLEKLNFFKESIFSLKKEIAEDEELIVGLTNSNEGFQEEIKKLKEEVEYWKEKAMENSEEINEVENYKESSQKMFDEYTKRIQEMERLKKKLSIKEATENKDVKIVMKPAEIELEEMLKKIEKDCCSECGITDHYCYIYNGRACCKQGMIETLLEDKVIK